MADTVDSTDKMIIHAILADISSSYPQEEPTWPNSFDLASASSIEIERPLNTLALGNFIGYDRIGDLDTVPSGRLRPLLLLSQAGNFRAASKIVGHPE